MRLYRGCMFSFLGVTVGGFSLLLAKGLGLVGFLLPWVMIGCVYMFVESLLIELIDWDRGRNSGS